MASWRFYQGLRTEWRWYHLDDAGNVIAESDQAFAELKACMSNAESAGFTGDAYQVHTRQGTGDTVVEDGKSQHGSEKSAAPPAWNGSAPKADKP